jgi:hypothetical protein
VKNGLPSKPDPEVDATPKRPSLSPRRGYFPVYRADIARIKEHDGLVSTPVLVSVWIALSDLANEHRSPCFTASIGVIRHRAGVSRRTAFAAVKVLAEELAMVEREQPPGADSSFAPNNWTLRQSSKEPCARSALGKRRTSAPKVPQILHTGVNKSLKETKEKEEHGPTRRNAPDGAAAGHAHQDAPAFCKWTT